MEKNIQKSKELISKLSIPDTTNIKLNQILENQVVMMEALQKNKLSDEEIAKKAIEKAKKFAPEGQETAFMLGYIKSYQDLNP